MRDIAPEVTSLFNSTELEEIAARAIVYPSGHKSDAIRLAAAWQLHVQKIDDDRALPQSDRTVWNEYDLVAALYIRDTLEVSMEKLSLALRERIQRYISAADEQFRSYTTDDSGYRISKVAVIDVTGLSWWWFRVPTSGPIVDDLSRYGHGQA